MPNRKQTFTEVIEEWDEQGLKKAVDFEQHRFISVERDKQTDDRFIKGHKTIRGACGHLSRAVQEGEPFVPEFIVDLDSGQRHELDLFVTVAPKSVEAVAVVFPPQLATAAVEACGTSAAQVSQQAAELIRKAIDRR